MSSERVPSSLQHTKEFPSSSSSSSSYSDGPRPKRERPRKERVSLHFHLSRMQIGIRALRRSFPRRRRRRRRLSGLSFYSLLSSSSCFYNTYHRRRRRPYTLYVPTVVCAMKVERGDSILASHTRPLPILRLLQYADP